MADTITNISIIHGAGLPPASVSGLVIRDTSERSTAALRAAELVAAVAGGVSPGTIAVRVDSATGATASGSFTCVQAQCTAGDKLRFHVPGYAHVFELTAVSGTPSAVAGEYAIITNDTAVAVSIKAAILALPGLRDIVTADNSSGTLTWTAKKAGSAGNSIKVTKAVTNAAAHVITDASGGLEISQKPSMTVTFGSANITADDTISIGGRKYTWKAAASLDGEITLSTTEATAATNFAAAINADATWTGLITASANSAIVTLTWEGDPRVGKHIVMDFTEVNAGSVVLGGTVIIGTGEAFSLSTTVTGSSATKRYQFGAA